MRHGSLFSGIGGFDLAAEWMGWENVFHCEWNTFGQKVLKHYWPNAELFIDITKSDFKKYHGTIDIISGGFPCQPYSAAGKRLGKEDSRHLWPEMLRAIQEIRPSWIVGENVLGLVNWNGGLVFHEVQTDLEAQGYEVQPVVLAAAGVGAPHRRDRIWFVAYSNRNGLNERNCKHEKQSSERRVNALCNIDESDEHGDASDTTGEQGEWVRPQFRESCEQEQEQFRGNGSDVGSERNAADTDSSPTGTSGASRSVESNRSADDVQQSERGSEAEQHNRPFAISRDAADTDGIRQRGQSDGVGESKFNGKNCKRDDWANFPTQSPICVRNDGISKRLDGITFPKWRNESIKAAGNAICPQVVFQIFKAIQQYEQLNTTT